jgi:diguanylate cyclase (GGDEF)-like protein/PAS domain S-box-containing protein
MAPLAALRPLRVLVVDDPAGTLLIVDELARAGFEPSFSRVDTLPAFEEAFAEETWDLVVADYALPGVDAHGVLRHLGGGETAVPVIVVSGQVEEEKLLDVLGAGAQDCVLKGNLGRLGPAVHRELRQSAVRRAYQEAETARVSAEERYRVLVEEVPALTFVAWADELGSLVYVSPQLKAMTGFSPTDWLADPRSWMSRLHPDDRDRVLAEYRQSCITGKPFVSEYRILDRDEAVRWWRADGRVMPDKHGRPQFVRGYVVDITEQRRAEEAASFMAYHDPATGLPNRPLLLKRLDQALEDGKRDGRPLALMLLTLDRYRDIASTLGHANADLMVRDLVARLGEVLGEADRVARLRGDEFAVILPDAQATLALQVAAKIQRALEHPFMVEKLPIEVGAHIGISLFPEHGETAELLLRRADTAGHAAAENGSGGVVYAPERDPYDPARLALLGELRQALEADQLRLHYQPKIDLKTHRMTGTEALLRWKHPRRGMVPPDQFIPLAERTGLIRPLTRWVLDRAVTQCAAWARQHQDFAVAVNLSARDLQDPLLVDHVVSLLESRGLAPDRLELELTESAVMADPGRAAQTFGELKRRGFSVAIDDFGTGYSSLTYLRTMPVSQLKIDKSFVERMGDNGRQDVAIVRSTSELGHSLGLKVVAEGVEDAKTLDLLSSFGCDAAQGFYIARPMPPAELMGWLKASCWNGRAS